MVTNQPEENQNPQVQQEVLKHITVGKNLTTGNITVQNYYGTQPPPAPPPLPAIDELVEQVRSLGYNKIKTMHGTMRMLRVNRPIPVHDIYIDLNVLEQVSSDRAFADWRKEFQPGWRSFDRLGLERIKQERVPALEKVRDCSKLMVLGKPGAGKTTLLKSVAIACLEGQLQWDSQNYVPVFVTLKDFAEDVRDDRLFNLFEAIQREFRSWGVTDSQVTEAILAQGRGLILLDGLDEVPESESRSVVKQIDRFCQDYYSNRFLITCRTQNQKYRFKGFTDVDVADFNPKQVAKFVRCWFAVVVGNAESEVLAEELIRQLEREENKQIAELAVTPVLLNLTCSVFRDTGSFPTNRASLYQKGLRALLEDWDEWKGVERDGIYGNLTTEDKEKLLAQVAAVLFEENNYFPERSNLEQLIGEHLKISRSEAGKVLRAIESQHGLLVERSEGFYSFSHLTFQEYFTAKWFVDRSDWKGLVRHVTEERWREVFLLVVNMTNNPDGLLKLMKQHIDKFAASFPHLQAVLFCANEKYLSVKKTNYNSTAIRVFFFAFNLDSALVLESASRLSNAFALAIEIDLVFALDRSFILDLAQATVDFVDNGYLRHFTICPTLKSRLERFKLLLEENKQYMYSSLCCYRQLKEVLFSKGYYIPYFIEIQNFSERGIQTRELDDKKELELRLRGEQLRVIRQYYNMNKLIIDCLKCNSYIDWRVKSEIEENLFLPVEKIRESKKIRQLMKFLPW